MERYDAVVLGAGPDGLIAAHRLARAGLKILVVEKQPQPGGRAITREFHPGYRASPYVDELSAIPSGLFWRLDPARHGAILGRAPASTCVSGGESTILYTDDARAARLAGPTLAPNLAALRRELAATRESVAARAVQPVEARRSLLPWRVPRRLPWPGEAWGGHTLAGTLADRIGNERFALHLAAAALSGRAASPYLAGTALHLLNLDGGSGVPAGGLGAFAAALGAAARAAGAVIRCDADVTDIRISQGRAAAVVLAGGEEIGAGAVLSTLDLKRTILGLIPWSELAEAAVRRVAQFRMAASGARVLFALDSIPKFPFASDASEAAHGPIHIVESMDAFSRVHDSWRAGILADSVPVTLRLPSLTDPRLAPEGCAVMTATLGAVPGKLFDGEWTASRRGLLVKIALLAAERVSPGIAGRVIWAETIIAPDVERELGLTGGDLDGGEIAPDQTFGFRPLPEWQDGRTPLRGVYLGGPSAAPSPFLLGAASERAAESLLADLKSGRLK